MAPPKVFVSYSHDSADHKAWVLRLGSDLRAQGIDVTLDRWDLAPGQDVSMFMQRGIAESDRVVMICSATYVEKAERGVGGVGYERLIVTAEVIQSIDTIKFIPVVRSNGGPTKVPAFLGPRLYVDFTNDGDYDDKLVELAKEIHGVPITPKPPLGPNPFSGVPVSVPPPRTEGREERFLGDDWYGKEQGLAKKGLLQAGLLGSMELRFGIEPTISKSQIELLSAVRQSEVHTFGWPIAITLENREEYRPRPYGDGIRAEISINDGGRQSYDYWALRSNGDFYLLQSLFEDSRRANEIFFDTRVIRVTEALMFAENLYTKLGVPPATRVGIRVSHDGLIGRTLTSASPNRLVHPRKTSEVKSVTEIVTVLGEMKSTRVADVRKLLEPMFMLFDFAEFNPQVYEELVTSFERGEVR